MGCVGVTGGPCAQAQSCNVFLCSQCARAGEADTRKSLLPPSLRRSDPVSIRRFVTDGPIRTPVTPRELKITHRLPSFVCCESRREGVEKNPKTNPLCFPFLMSLIVFHIRLTGRNPKANRTRLQLLSNSIFTQHATVAFNLISVFLGFTHKLSSSHSKSFKVLFVILRIIYFISYKIFLPQVHM